MQRWNTVTMGKVLDYMRFPHAYALFPRKDSRANRPAKARASGREAYQNLYEEPLTFEERPTFRLTKLREREILFIPRPLSAQIAEILSTFDPKVDVE